MIRSGKGYLNLPLYDERDGFYERRGESRFVISVGAERSVGDMRRRAQQLRKWG